MIDYTLPKVGDNVRLVNSIALHYLPESNGPDQLQNKQLIIENVKVSERFTLYKFENIDGLYNSAAFLK